MDQTDSYVSLLGTYALLYSLAYIVYQRFKSRLPKPDVGEGESQNPEQAEFL